MFGVLWGSFPLRCAVLANLVPTHFLPFFHRVGMPRLLGSASGAREHILAIIAHTFCAFLGQLYCGVCLLRFHSAACRALDAALALLTVVAHAPFAFFGHLFCGVFFFRFHSVTLRALLQRAQLDAVAASSLVAALNQFAGGEVTSL